MLDADARAGTLGFAVALLALSTTSALTAAGPPPEIRAHTIQLQAAAGYTHAKVAKFEGHADEKGERFLLTNLLTTQPVVLSVEAQNPGDRLTLSVFKNGWKDPKRQVSTGDRPMAATEFRTSGDAEIQVTSAEGSRPFVLRAVVGNGARPPMKAAFMPMDQYRQRHPERFGAHSVWLWGGALMVGLAGGLVFLWLKRRPA
jgi:hypothetical protein